MKSKLISLAIIFIWIIGFIPLVSQTQFGSDIGGEAPGDLSGSSVFLSPNGKKVAIGAPGNNENGTAAGQVRVFKWDGLEWTQLGADIIGEGELDFTGISVSLSSDGYRLAIGARAVGINGAGRVRVYKWDGIGISWVQLGEDIEGEANADGSGRSISLSSDGNRLAIGAPFNNGSGYFSGHVRVFEWNYGGWAQIGEDIDGEAPENLSGIVSLSSDGNRLAIGAPYNDVNGLKSGHVRVYELSGMNWVQLGEDIDGEAENDKSGTSVSLSSDGSRLAIGAPGNDGNGPNSGHVRVYDWDGLKWVQVGQDIDGEKEGNQVGISISLSSGGNRLAVGGLKDDFWNELFEGQAQIFDWNGANWVQVGHAIKSETAQDGFGSVSLSSDGNRLAIGFPKNDGNGLDAGHVRVFDLQTVATTIRNFSNSVQISPNPGQGMIYLDIDLLNKAKTLDINVFNILGEMVYFEQISVLKTERVPLNLEHLSAGIYLIYVTSEKNNCSKVVIIQ